MQEHLVLVETRELVQEVQPSVVSVVQELLVVRLVLHMRVDLRETILELFKVVVMPRAQFLPPVARQAMGQQEARVALQLLLRSQLQRQVQQQLVVRAVLALLHMQEVWLDKIIPQALLAA
jgi:hypothetical protein